MGCTPAPTAVAALAEASSLWPNRRRTSDGICASPEHTTANPGSDHEPHVVIRGTAYASAFDLSDDKPNGCDADALVEQLRQRRDPRVKYVIAERRMYSSYPTSTHSAWTWRPYNGSNPHSSHVHVSLLPDALFDLNPWWNLEDDVTEADKDEIVERVIAVLAPMIDEVKNAVAGYGTTADGKREDGIAAPKRLSALGQHLTAPSTPVKR